MKALNIQIEDHQHEWLRRRAFETRESIAQIVRGLLDRAMGGPQDMSINDLIQAAEAGRTLRQVLERTYGKPADQIDAEGADLDEYRHDLDERIIRIYAMVDDHGQPNGDVALVAGQTIWQDCETANIVTSIDEEVEDTFLRDWVRVYPDVDAILVHSNAYDTVLVSNGTQPALSVDPDVFRAFAEEPGDWGNWGSPESWAEHGDTIGEAAPKYGQIVAYYDGRELTVVDQARWDERRRFYGLD